MKRLLRQIYGLLAAVLLTLTPLVTVSAQPTSADTVFTAQIAEIDVVLTHRGSLFFDPSQYQFNITGAFVEEYIWALADPTYTSYELILVDGPTDAQQYMDSTTPNLEKFYDSWEILDQSANADTAWFLGEAEMNGSLMLVYFEYQVDVFGDIDLAYMQFSKRENFIPDMQMVQRELSIGELTVPLNPDKTAISEIVGMQFPHENSATPVVDTADRWTALGLDADDTWVSPTFGTSLEWDMNLWRFPYSYDSAIYVNPDGWDVLTLMTIDGRGYVRFYIYSVDEYTPEIMIADWMFDEYPVSFEDGLVILDAVTTQNSASVAYITRDEDGRETAVLVDVSFRDDGTMIYTELTTSPQGMVEAYTNVVEGIQVNSSALILTWDVEHIESLVP